MCGLVGVAGWTGIRELRAFHYLLDLDTVRGPHSTGVVKVDRDGNVLVNKALGTPWDFREEFKDFPRKSYPHQQGGIAALMGHNRYATVGEVNVENAHPFEIGDTILCHNGTLNKYDRIKNGYKHTVDSKFIAQHLEDGKDLKDTLQKIQGAWALSIYNKANRQLSFVRNSQRPLHFCYSKDAQTIFWASEKWMLEVALSACGIPHQDIWMLKVNTRFDVKVNERIIRGKRDVTITEGYEGGTNCYEPYKPWKKPASKSVWKPAKKVKQDKPKDPVPAKSNDFVWHFKSFRYHTDAGTGSTYRLAQEVGGHRICRIYITAKESSQNINMWIDKFVAPVDGSVRYHDAHTGKIFANQCRPRDMVVFPSDKKEEKTEEDGESGRPDNSGGKCLSNSSKESEELPWAYGPSREILRPDEFDKLTGEECSNCLGTIRTKDHQDIAWISYGGVTSVEAICGDCYNDEDVRNLFEEYADIKPPHRYRKVNV